MKFFIVTVVVLNLILPEASVICQISGNKNRQQDNEDINFNSLLLSIDGNSQTNTFGLVNNDVKQPNVNGSLTFYSKHNFDISFQPSFTLNSDTSYSKTTAEMDFMAGYTWQPGKKLSFYPSYTHILYDKSSGALQKVFNNIFELDAYYTTKVYKPALTVCYLSGTKNMFYFSLQNSFDHDFEDIGFKNSLLSLGLSLDLNISDKNFYNSLIYYQWKSADFLQWVYLNRLGPLRMVRDQIQLYGLDATKKIVYDRVNSTDPTVFGTKYTLTSVDIMVPVYYSVNDLMFNVTGFLIVPTQSSDFYDRSTQLIVNVGVSYSFNFLH